MTDTEGSTSSKVRNTLFHSSKVGDAFLRMLDNPVFVQMARDPENVKDKSVWERYMMVRSRHGLAPFGAGTDRPDPEQNNFWWIREEVDGRLGRIEMVPPDEAGTKLYEQQKLEKFRTYVAGPHADYLRGIGIDPNAPTKPNEATLAYAAVLKEAKTYLEATVVRAA